jgi:hypothetical protein
VNCCFALVEKLGLNVVVFWLVETWVKCRGVFVFVETGVKCCGVLVGTDWSEVLWFFGW